MVGKAPREKREHSMPHAASLSIASPFPADQKRGFPIGNRVCQRSLFCPCGRETPAVAGLCLGCYRRERRSVSYFGGNRERALDEDGRQCRVCGPQPVLHVHHRRRGDHAALVTLCAGCHARVHRTFSLRRWMPELLLLLWREWHPDTPEQLQLPILAPMPTEIVAALRTE